MCGRYSLSKGAKEVGSLFDVVPDTEILGMVYNASPTDTLPVITMQEPSRLQGKQWGIKCAWGGAKEQLHINARSESVFEKNTFKNLIKTNRCLIPADGFYEWSGNGRVRQPWRFSLKSGELFAFAGLYSTIPNQGSGAKAEFCILTTQANRIVEPYHNRMPVIILKERAKLWLEESDNDALLPMFTPLDEGLMMVYKVSPKLNKAGVNYPELINPWHDPELTLF